MEDGGLFYGHLFYIGTLYTYIYLVYFVAIWYILWSFGTLSPILVSCTKKNLATLQRWLSRSIYKQTDNISESIQQLTLKNDKMRFRLIR
jgi:hypothetical protein